MFQEAHIGLLIANRFPSRAEQVYDLKTLRQLVDFSLRLDPVEFLSYLESLRASEGTRSVWLFLPQAHVLFDSAKARVFRLAQVLH
jgi:DNA excision repair protein ERCC-4